MGFHLGHAIDEEWVSQNRLVTQFLKDIAIKKLSIVAIVYGKWPFNCQEGKTNKTAHFM